MQSDWQTGFCVGIRVANQGRSVVNNWRLTFDMNQATINQSWNGTFSRQGTRHTVTPPSWGQRLQPGQSVDLGFCANKQGPDYQPRNAIATAI